MKQLGNGLGATGHNEDALSVRETELSMLRRLGADEEVIFAVQQNLAGTYRSLGRLDDCLRTQRGVYSGTLKLYGEQDRGTLVAALNYANSLRGLQRSEEAKPLLRKNIPVVRRVMGEGHRITLKMRWSFAISLYWDPSATLDDLREAVSTLEDVSLTARRVFGGTHPTTADIERALGKSLAKLSAREGDVSSVCEAVEAMTTGDA